MKTVSFLILTLATSAFGQYVITEVPCGEVADGVGGLTDRGAIAATCAVDITNAVFLPFLINKTGPHDLGLGAVGTIVFASGINKHEQVIANRAYPGNERAYLYDRGAIIDLGTLGGSFSYAAGIDDFGQVVGAATLAGDETGHAFLYRKGVMHDLGAFGGTSSAAGAINNRGQVVINRSVETNGGTLWIAGIYFEGQLQDIGSLGSDTYGLGINALGHVVGMSLTADRREFHAFFYHDGQMEDASMTSLPDTWAGISSINDSDEMVGSYYREFDAEIVYGGFLYKDGIRTDVAELLPANSGWTIRSAVAINNLGQIAGIGLYNRISSNLSAHPTKAACQVSSGRSRKLQIIVAAATSIGHTLRRESSHRVGQAAVIGRKQRYENHRLHRAVRCCGLRASSTNLATTGPSADHRWNSRHDCGHRCRSQRDSGSAARHGTAPVVRSGRVCRHPPWADNQSSQRLLHCARQRVQRR